MSINKAKEAHVEQIIQNSVCKTIKFEEKTLIVILTLPNGEVKVDSHTFTDEFNPEIGLDICLKRIGNSLKHKVKRG